MGGYFWDELDKNFRDSSGKINLHFDPNLPPSIQLVQDDSEIIMDESTFNRIVKIVQKYQKQISESEKEDDPECVEEDD